MSGRGKGGKGLGKGGAKRHRKVLRDNIQVGCSSYCVDICCNLFNNCLLQCLVTPASAVLRVLAVGIVASCCSDAC
jgi:hypothetical protein